MKFFVPTLEEKDWERAYEGIAKFNEANVPPKKKDRVAAIGWTRFGREHYAARVGEPIHADFGGEIVLAIIQTEMSSFAVCTPNRGGARGQAVHVNFSDVTSTEKFSG